jgi:extracellular elastinolytic metalloproteinase
MGWVGKEYKKRPIFALHDECVIVGFFALSTSISMRRYLFVSLALALPLIRAHPASRNSKTHLTKRIVDLKAFSLKVASKYTDSASVESNARLSASSRGSPQDTASELVPGANFRLVESVPGSAGVTHVYFRQTANELDIVNADFNVNVSVPLQLPNTSNSDCIDWP